jgi:hypothetical protein
MKRTRAKAEINNRTSTIGTRCVKKNGNPGSIEGKLKCLMIIKEQIFHPFSGGKEASFITRIM